MFVQARSLALSIRLAEFRAEWLDLPKQDDNPLLSVPWRRRCAPRKHHCGLRNHEPRNMCLPPDPVLVGQIDSNRYSKGS
jgi:hypothetical protein